MCCRVGQALIDDLGNVAVHRRVNRQVYMRQLGSMSSKKSSALFRPLGALDFAKKGKTAVSNAIFSSR